MTGLDLFNLTGTTLFGTSWHGDVSRRLGVNLRTVERWSKGQSRISPGVWSDLLKMLADRQAELARLQPLLERQAASTSTSTSE